MTFYEWRTPVRHSPLLRTRHSPGTVVSNPIADIVRRKLDAGTLPPDTPKTLWKGIGSGKPCSACEAVILSADVEFEPQYDDGRRVVRFHVGCYGIWEVERRLRGYAR
jgi:hypothetical protein